ncbi:hypothetical protein Tco_0281933, partial [Tanacetum coccineum]
VGLVVKAVLGSDGGGGSGYEIVKSLGVSFDLSPRQKAVVECLRAPRAQNFLTVIPIEGLGQHMSALEYRTILKYRLMIPLFPVDEPCPVCRKVCLDSFGEHAVHCKELPGFKYRHDLVRDVLYDVLKRAGISSRKEAPVNFLTDPLEGRSTLRPADILVFRWAGGKHACVDLTGVSPLVGLKDNGFVAGQAALKAESSKVAKHEKACLENQHVFIPFAFDTFGFLAPEAEEFLNRVQRVVQSNFSTPKTQNFIFSRIGFAIQKGVAAQLVARLPAILLQLVSSGDCVLSDDGFTPSRKRKRYEIFDIAMRKCDCLYSRWVPSSESPLFELYAQLYREKSSADLDLLLRKCQLEYLKVQWLTLENQGDGLCKLFSEQKTRIIIASLEFCSVAVSKARSCGYVQTGTDITNKASEAPLVKISAILGTGDRYLCRFARPGQQVITKEHTNKHRGGTTSNRGQSKPNQLSVSVEAVGSCNIKTHLLHCIGDAAWAVLKVTGTEEHCKTAVDLRPETKNKLSKTVSLVADISRKLVKRSQASVMGNSRVSTVMITVVSTKTGGLAMYFRLSLITGHEEEERKRISSHRSCRNGPITVMDTARI